MSDSDGGPQSEQTPGSEPGWYGDLQDPQVQRFWNGERWTEQTRSVPEDTEWTPSSPGSQASRQSMSPLERAAMESIRNGGRVRTWGQLVGYLMVLGGAIITLFGFGNGVVPAVIAIGITNVLIGMLVASTTVAFGWHVELSGHTAILLWDQDRESRSD